jgi:uncharacterized delta-60 repeat protein
MLKSLFIGALLLGATLSASAQGTLDPAFGNGGYKLIASNATALDLIALDGGKTLVCGNRVAAGIEDLYFSRLNADGSLDTGYLGGGVYVLPGSGVPSSEHMHACALARDGSRVYVAVLEPDRVAVRALDANGMPIPNDPLTAGVSFVLPAQRGFVDVVARNGAIYIAVGTRIGTENGRVFKINALGQLATSWGSGGIAIVDDGSTIGDLRRIALTPANRVLALTRQLVAGGHDHAVVELFANGLRNTAFGGTGVVRRSLGNYDFAREIVSYADGRFLIAGTSCSDAATDGMPTSGCQFGLARYLANGQPDVSFGASGARRFGLGFDAFLYGAAIDPQGRIIGVGSTIGESPLRAVITRVRADGQSLDTTYGSGGATRSTYNSSDSLLASAIAETAGVRTVGRGYYARGDGGPLPYALAARYTQ